MKNSIRIIVAGLALAPFASAHMLTGMHPAFLALSPVLAAQTQKVNAGAENASETAEVAELKKQLAELRAEVEKIKTAHTEENDEGERAGTPSDLAPLHIYGTVECDLDKLPELPEAQLRQLKQWRLLRLGEWNAAARLAAAEHGDVEETDDGTAHRTINLHWTPVRKAGGVTTICCHVAEDTCGPFPINSVYAFNFVGDTDAVVTPRKLFAGPGVLGKLRELIELHRDEATGRCFGDYDAKWEKKHAGEFVTQDSEETDDVAPAPDPDGTEHTDDDEETDGDKFRIDWFKLTQIAVTEDHLLFCFDQGSIAPIGEGALVIPVPASEVLELLSPEARSLFPKH